MSEPFIAEVRIFAGNFAPRSWAFCNGQLLPISQNTALFSLIGTTYGGDGRTTTALPNLQGRAPMHPGRGPGLTSRLLGERGGVETVSLSEDQMPNHNHSSMAALQPASTNTPNTTTSLSRSVGAAVYNSNPTSTTAMNENVLSNDGGSQPHNNLQPYTVINYIIALQGLYPSRS